MRWHYKEIEKRKGVRYNDCRSVTNPPTKNRKVSLLGTGGKKKTVKNRCNAYIYRRCGGFSYVLFLSVFVRFYAFETVKILTKLSRSRRRLRTAPSATILVALGGKLI